MVRANLVLPRDVMLVQHFLLARIEEPKTRMRMARHQAAKIEQADLVLLIETAFGDLPASERLWPRCSQTLRRRFDLVLERLGRTFLGRLAAIHWLFVGRTGKLLQRLLLLMLLDVYARASRMTTSSGEPMDRFSCAEAKKKCEALTDRAEQCMMPMYRSRLSAPARPPGCRTGKLLQRLLLLMLLDVYARASRMTTSSGEPMDRFSCAEAKRKCEALINVTKCSVNAHAVILTGFQLGKLRAPFPHSSITCTHIHTSTLADREAFVSFN